MSVIWLSTMGEIYCRLQHNLECGGPMSVSSLRNVLVTGGGGYIGSHVVLALLDAGYRVTVIDNLSTGVRWAVPPAAYFCAGDVADRPLVSRLIDQREIGAIMHFAGSVIVPESVSDPLKYYRNNMVGSEALLECAVSNGVRHFVFSSSAAVYGHPASMLVTEDAVTRPLNPYGESKLMTEIMLRDVAVAHPLNFCALRYFNVAGADPDGRTGQATVAATHLIKVAVEAALGKRDEIVIFGDDYATADGTGVRDYIHVSDLAFAHVAALERLTAEPLQSLTLNCGYGRGYSVLEVLDTVERVAGTRVQRRVTSRRAGDSAALMADNRRILATLEWKPKYADLETIISHALAWERKLPR
jgi:UDP-glucose 4-epimerase